MTRLINRRGALTLMAFGGGSLLHGAVLAAKRATGPAETYSSEEIVSAGHSFFGGAARGLGEAVEYVFKSQGEPTGYIVGEEGAGAFVGGLRYGEGTIYYNSGIRQKIFWQGPSIGFDFGGNGSRALVLVYNSASPRDIYEKRFMGVEGSAYLVGGLGVNFQEYRNIVLAPIRTGLGARLGANLGYLKYSKRPSWNPF
ncbi:DUF1134 domain-containing protein [soil metagenome]